MAFARVSVGLTASRRTGRKVYLLDVKSVNRKKKLQKSGSLNLSFLCLALTLDPDNAGKSLNLIIITSLFPLSSLSSSKYCLS